MGLLPTAGFVQAIELFDRPRTDGISFSGGTLQGARTYDRGSHQWTAPDAYAGDVHDPMSQKAYMWNNNNPIMYSDPSGYEAEEESEDRVGGDLKKLFANAKIETYGQRQIEAVGRQIGGQAGVPKNWSVSTNTRTGAVKFTQPGTNGASQVRIMPGNADSKWPSQRLPYVTRVVNGRYVDANGKYVDRQSAASHIPIKDFDFNTSTPKE